MKKILFLVLLFFLVGSTASANVDIDKKNRIKNYYPGWCVWTSLETLGRHQGIKELENLAKNREKDPDYVEWWFDGVAWRKTVWAKNYGSEGSVREKLGSLNVRFSIYHWSRIALERASSKNGCVVFMNACSQWSAAHAITLTHYDNRKVEFIDPNTIIYYVATREWFDTYWEGTSITLEK